jgi:hypothetical protein
MIIHVCNVISLSSIMNNTVVRKTVQVYLNLNTEINQTQMIILSACSTLESDQ